MSMCHLICEENSCCHAWEHEEEQREELQQGGQDATSLGVTDVLGG